MPKYLKDLIGEAGGILTARIMSIGPIEENKNGKELRKVQFLFPATGRTHEDSVFEFNFKPPRGSLVGLKIGDTVEMKLDNGWPAFKIISGDAESAPPASQTSYEQVRGERAATKVLVASDDARELKDIQICLQGFVQAFLIQGLNTDEAIDMAVLAREQLLAKAKEIHHGISLPVQTTKIEEVPWGDDEVAPFPSER